jgi:CHAT domain-containing protein/Flp pilus assembly protein TadD
MALLLSIFPLFIDNVFAKELDVNTVAKADSLYAEGTVLADSFRYAEAIAKYRQALEIDRNLFRQKKIAADLNSIGEAYYEISEYDSAFYYSDTALVLARKAKDKTTEIAALNNIGRANTRTVQYEKAVTYLRMALNLAVKVKNRYWQGPIHINFGECYIALSQAENALIHLDSALFIAREINNKRMECRALALSGGNYYYLLSQIHAASIHYDSAFIIAREVKDKWTQCYLFSKYGMLICDMQGDYEKTLIYFDSALTIARDIKDRYRESYVLSDIGFIYSARLMQAYKGTPYYDSALSIQRMIGDKRGEARNLCYIGDDYQMFNSIEVALVYYDSALVIQKQIADNWSIIHTYQSIGWAYRYLYQTEKALVYYDSTLMVSREIKNRYNESWALCMIGDMYHELKQYDRALCYHDSALALCRELEQRTTLSISLLGAARDYHALGFYERAASLFDTALTYLTLIDHRAGKYITFSCQGENFIALGRYEQALACFDSSLVLSDQWWTGVNYHGIARVYEKTGDLEKAVSYYKQAIDAKESIRESYREEANRQSFIEMEKGIYEQLINILIKVERYNEAFEYLERSHSQKLKKAIEEQGITAYDSSMARILERINSLHSDIATLETQLQAKAITLEEYKSQRSMLEGTLNQELFDLKTYHPQLYNMMMPQVKDYKDIQKNITPNIVFLEFTAVEDKYVVFIFTNDKFLLKSYDVSKTKIDSLIEMALTDLKWLKEKELIDQHFEDLYNILIKSIEQDIKDFSHVVIIPYGLLHYVPFHALRRQNDKGEAEYFVQWKKISYLPSALFITDLLASKTHAKKDLLAFANCDGSLPSAEVEVDSILEVYPKASVFKTDSATKVRLIEDCCNYKLLHLATHGVLNSDPRFSYIVLSPPETGNLTVREILGLSGQFRNTSLITLSACETAIEEDPQKAGMELTTLSNAFKVAGVPSIVATLWEIGDRSTAMLMKDFYGNLKKKMNKLEALRQAQLTMINNPEYSHPYYWAPFMLIGEWR